MALTDAEKIVVRSQIAALRLAIASGILNVRHGDTSTTFQSTSEMRKAIADLEASLGERPKSRVRYIYQAGKGL